MKLFTEWLSELTTILNQTEFSDSSGSRLEADKAYATLIEVARDIMNTERRIYFIGNGASASMASHIAADMGKNGKIKTDVFTDLALLTAIVNDLGGENIFSAPLRTQAQTGDALVVISSSGNSTNLIRAIEVAHNLNLKIVTFTAMTASNRIRTMGDINVWAPASTYGCAESAHAALLHCWVDNLIDDFTEKSLL